MLKTHYGETLLLVLALVMGFIMAVAVILLDGIALNISNVFKIWAMISLVIIAVWIRRLQMPPMSGTCLHVIC